MKKKTLSILLCSALVMAQGVCITPNVFAATTSTSASAAVASTTTISVDKNFAGNNGSEVNGIKTYKTLQAAVNSVSATNSKEVKILIKNGTYKEKVKIDRPNITLVGEDSYKTVLTFDDAAGTIKRAADGGDGTATYGTTGSASITVTGNAKNFCAANLTIENSFDEIANIDIKNQQAVALKNEADQSAFYNCRFIGNQDTLYANKNRQYYYNCHIEGDVDFIFGAASAVFEKCEIKSVDRANAESKGYVVAPSTLSANKYGFLILNSKLTSNITQTGTVFLGRPWHPSSCKDSMNSNTVYMNCEMGAHISSTGWDNMSGNSPLDNDMYEYGSYGPGALTSSTRRVLTNEQAASYSKDKFLTTWNAEKVVSRLASY